MSNGRHVDNCKVHSVEGVLTNETAIPVGQRLESAIRGLQKSGKFVGTYHRVGK